MTRDEFNAFIESAYARGLTHVETCSGSLPLEDWRPYGCFDGTNPGIERHIGGFRWINDYQAEDYPASQFAQHDTVGVWTFCDPDSEAVLAEQHRNYYRDTR